MTLIRTLLIMAVLGSVACAPDKPQHEKHSFWSSVTKGGYVETTSRYNLRGSEDGVLTNESLWKPMSIVPETGWRRAGRGWRPTGERASLRFWRRVPSAQELVLEFRNRTPGSAGRSYTVAIILNGQPIGEADIAPGRFQDRYAFPPSLLGDVNRLDLRFDPLLAVDSVIGDPLSLLGLAVAGSDMRVGPPAEGPYELESEVETLRLRISGSFVLPLQIPKFADLISMKARYEGDGLASLSARIFKPSGDMRFLDTVNLAPRTEYGVTGSLENLGGSDATLVLTADLPGEGTFVEISDFGFQFSNVGRAATVTPRGQEAAAGTSTTRTAQPDIVLIVLDAARGDRFPGWGYSRETMPNLDRLASEAMVFRQAFSECPTTSCSIPGLITGVSLLEGGDVGQGLQMSSDLTTLAEYLTGIGYRSVGFSATPNNSAARNMHQGFDTFRELWGRNNPDHGPFNLSRLALEQARSQPTSEPLFLQLHYLPPHQPYAPGAEFDLFTDDSYDGFVVPRMSLKKYSLGQGVLAERDLEELIGLYDGNLLRADAALGQLFSELDAIGRFDNALIVVTSDHGEAFMEHGFQGHNTTLFDEMLHVPLMIRLPGGEVLSGTDTERLASLLDVVPTILGYLGEKPAPEVDGVDLFHTRVTDTRTLVFRTSHPDHPMIASRTRYWKSISWPRHQTQMLFDLSNDPGETVNLVGDRPYVFAGMGLLARARLRAAQSRGLEGVELELDAETQEALRALGYLD